jgi:hypothetical protein
MVSAGSPQGGFLEFNALAGGPTATPTPAPTQTPAPPSNDHCEQAREIPRVPYIDEVDTTGALTDFQDPVPICGTGGRSHTVWYRLVPSFTGSLAITTLGSSYQTILSAYTGSCGFFSLLTDGCYPSDSYSYTPATVAVTKGVPYYFMVSAANDLGSAFHLGIRVAADAVAGDTPLASASPTPSSMPLATPSPTGSPSAAACAGDCDGTHAVTVNEILTLVNIALGNTDISACRAGDTSGDGLITVEEILTAVRHALEGC